MKIASFDIFDTTLIRKCGNPDNIFYLLAHRLYPHDKEKCQEFFLWRKGAERAAAPFVNGRQTTIGDIYWYGGGKKFKEYTLPQLIDAEEAVESENLTANPAIKAVIERHRSEGDTICFISDMYLDSRFLTTVLEREGCLQKGETVYVSCEEGARKSSGALYSKVHDLCRRPTAWEHYGDHPISDIRRAREKGIKAHLVQTCYTATEKMLTRTDNYALRCLAGLQRAARITAGCGAHAALAADFVAPSYIPYLHFIMQKAVESGVERLYFLSRDSYILQKIAEQSTTLYPGIELKYLFVSRKALLLPYLKEPTAQKFLAVQDKQTIVGQSVEELLKSLGTSSCEMKERFSTEFGFDKIRNKKEENEFLDRIFGEESEFKPHLQQMATEKRNLLNDYFAQEGLLDGTKSAMVDVGWLGTTRLMINSILREEGHSDTLFFYYGVRRDVLGTEHGEYVTYNTPDTSKTETTFLVEEYYSASPYQTTKGYRYEGESVKAELAGEENYDKVVENNCAVAMWLAAEIAKQPQAIVEAMRGWWEGSAAVIYDNVHLHNLTPFAERGISHKLGFKELINTLLLGGRSSLYEKGSIAMSVPRSLFKALYKLHELTAEMRHSIATFIYRWR